MDQEPLALVKAIEQALRLADACEATLVGALLSEALEIAIRRCPECPAI